MMKLTAAAPRKKSKSVHRSGGVAILVRKDIKIFKPKGLTMLGPNWAAVMIKVPQGAVLAYSTAAPVWVLKTHLAAARSWVL